MLHALYDSCVWSALLHATCTYMIHLYIVCDLYLL